MQTNIVVLPPPPAPPITSPPKLSIPSPPPTPLILQTSLQDEEIEAVPLPASPTQTTEDEKDTTKEQDITSPEQKDKRFKWADKYRPNALKDFLCNRNTALELKALAETDSSNRHYIFAGQPGVGKRTMIFALLREVFGHDKLQARKKCKVFYLKGEAVPSIQVNVKESKKHVEINLSETKGYEKHVIVELINERKHKASIRSAPCHPEDCKGITSFCNL
uniref:Replication factor C subunit 5-like n=1 Tax=Nicotiana sylvestris TaxID=4096 RepID=A0A1U7XBB2_NICSY|nr:PREDICTED: replication factor C subunit 5-like [Nicotiana sylvestris]